MARAPRARAYLILAWFGLLRPKLTNFSNEGNFWNFVGEKILQEISKENIQVEHDFSGGLSSRVILKFGRRLPNLTKLLVPQDFWHARADTFFR